MGLVLVMADDFVSGTRVPIASWVPLADPVPARVLFKQDFPCGCGGPVYHCELGGGRHVDLCATSLSRQQ